MADSGVGLVQVDGTFGENAVELAMVIDRANGIEKENAEGSLTSEISKLTEDCEANSSEIVRLLVGKVSPLLSAGDRDFERAAHLLLYFIMNSSEKDQLLPGFISQIKDSGRSSSSILSVLSCLFNLLNSESEPHKEAAFPVLKAIIDISFVNGQQDTLTSYIDTIYEWLNEWPISDSERLAFVIDLSDRFAKSGDVELSYTILLAAATNKVHATPSPETIVNLIKKAIYVPAVYEFDDLRSLDSVRSSRDSKLVQLLEIFSDKQFKDYKAFASANQDWLTQEFEPSSVADLEAKMRLLTLATAASVAEDRKLSYDKIAEILEIPDTEVETWVIDVIRSGLVEGKLSQPKRVFLIHRSSYRTFGDSEWDKVSERLNIWEGSLQNILSVIRQARENAQSEGVGRFRVEDSSKSSHREKPTESTEATA